MEKTKRILRAFDMFSSLPTLRTKSQPETTNACGGILSIIILILFAFLFIYQSYLSITYQQISSTMSISNNLQSQFAITDFMAAIGVQGFDLASTYPFMRFEFVELTLKGTDIIGFRLLQKQPCQISHLSALGADAQKSYNSFNMQNKYCLKPQQNITINQISTGQYKILSVNANSCLKIDSNQQNIYTGCATPQQFQYGNQLWISLHKYFTANVIYINTGFKASEKQSTNKFMDVIRSTFTIKRGSETLVYLSPYSITTDTSILPYENNQIQKGYTFDRLQIGNFQADPHFEMVTVFFAISSKNINFTRSLGKIDQILSYVGGLFGIIMAIIAFFMASFNQYKYEIMVAQGAFNYSDDGTTIKQHDFHFLQYIKYSVFDWICTLTFFQPKWKNCKQIQETRQQANKQLDVALLFKKIQHFQKVIQYLVSDRQNIGIYLTEPPTIDEVRRTRRIAEYYDKVIKGKAATTVQDIQNINAVFHFAMNQISGENSKSELVVRNSSSKRRLFDEIGKQRQNILDRILQQFKQPDLDIEDVNLDEQDLKMQLQIAQSFFRMEQNARKKIQQKIPLKILYRLKKTFESSISKQSVIINLQI